MRSTIVVELELASIDDFRIRGSREQISFHFEKIRQWRRLSGGD